MIYQEAVDEIFGRFADAWEDTGFTVIYPDRPLTPSQSALIAGTSTDGLQPWARLTIRAADRERNTIGQLMYTTSGVLIVEIYTPTGDGHRQAYTLGKIVQDAFELHNVSSYRVWYREVEMSEAGSEGVWSRLNVTVFWEAQELK